MSTITTPTVGSIISSAKARKITYAIYGCAAVAVGGAAAYFLGIGHPEPEYVQGAQAVVAYLSIPFAGLAIANVPASVAK